MEIKLKTKLKKPLFSELQYGESFVIYDGGLHYYIKVNPRAKVNQRAQFENIISDNDILNFEYGLDFDVIINKNLNAKYGLAFDIINNRLILIKMDQPVTKIKKSVFLSGARIIMKIEIKD